ncbi:MAG: signal peptidase I [Cryomorphaceae bacterium]|jgi:signal peptidase I|nr:signal peptidase I [Cryomorphaceae bacterium]MBT3502925.1 signal peptidase I [Cryomorphaceae bacterium]MBT3688700.1 signal peptidase I [Cryomorphaceae bacterium]MBT4222586.1 signal peptidase I [Cryomorphaceae bacterium]MBT4292983.1 signal peptidase I [Cryomorphaceae bacterium]
MSLYEWFLLFLSFNLIIFGGSYKLFNLAGVAGWKALIPFYNIIKYLDIIKRPRWWTILVFIPVINLLMIPVIWIEFIKTFNHSTKSDRILVIITLGLYIYYVSYVSNKTKYIDEISFSNFERSFGSIIFAVVIATIVHNYIIQPFVIPTGSLEKTLRVGDFLLVSKFHYGARIPSTVISFPMVHDTIPIIKSRSYLKKPQLPYLRIPGFQEIKNNDIVVFNWPADTVRKFFVKEKGVIKPIDKKSNYVKRAIGIPGDTLEIRDGLIYLNGKENTLPDRAKPLFTYLIKSDKGVSSSKLINLQVDGFIRKFIIRNLSTDTYAEISKYILNISNTGENEYLIYTTDKGVPVDLVRKLGLDIREIIDNEKELSLTYIDAIKIENSNQFDTIYRLIEKESPLNSIFFPNNKRFNWNNDQFGPIYIPKAGDKIDLNINTLPLYKKIIIDYEYNDLRVVEEDILINGKIENEYIFKQDYYWMMGDNRYNSEDSRVWGFVPYNHVLGKPVFIWMSIEGLFNGIENWKFRWDRVFTTIGFNGKPRSYLPHFIIFIIAWQLFYFIKRRRNS